MARWTVLFTVAAVLFTGPVVHAQSECPNGSCEPGENCLNCPNDCGGPCVCGNGSCEPDEHCANCVADCGPCPFCGDGAINQADEQCDPPGSRCMDGQPCQNFCICPGPDDCEDAIPIFDGHLEFSTQVATTDGLPHKFCKFDGQTYNDIWYNYIATCSGRLTVSMCNNASYDTDLVVYGGCQPDDWTCPPGDAEVLGCNDDDGCAGFTSTVSIAQILEGNCYTIRIGGWQESDMGRGTVTVSCSDCTDGICTDDETCHNCPQDCGQCVCGDGNCTPGETCAGCETDCGSCPFCGDGVCQPELKESMCDCPEDCPGDCPCVIFTNQTEFEIFNVENGQILNGLEDFEASVLPPATYAVVDDPLCGGIPSLPVGFPYPIGIDEPTICIQSNFEHSPASPNPRGTSGLLALSAGYESNTSDVVVATFGRDSLDINFSNPRLAAVGMNPITIDNGPSVDIRAYDKDNALLIAGVWPADEAGSNFWGVWCSNPPGRINIYDPPWGDEGADNIQLWVPGVSCGDCPTDVDGNGDTGATDLAVLLGSWGPCAPGHECACLDDDDDDIIGPFDLAVLLGAWGPCL